jgi:hypothetical protein
MSLIATLKHSGSSVAWTLGVIAAAILPGAAADVPAPKLSAAGWMQYGMIVKSDTTTGKKMDGRSTIGSGAQFAVTVNPSEHLRIEAGLGAAAGHSLAATSTTQGGYAPVEVFPYISNANFTYSLWNEEKQSLFFRGGLFPYDYNPDAQNLGLYLLRGPVYPGFVLSGFESKYVLPVANTLGIQVHHQTGGFYHDFLFTIETDFYPYYDMSPAYIANYQFGNVLRVGAGVNFYHLIPVDPELTKDTTKVFISNRTAIPETTVIAFSGTKVMANASLDLKGLFGAEGGNETFSEADLKLYGEVALIGLDNGPAYKEIYGSYSNRMPIMVGFNIPTFKILDRLSLEVEHYTAKFKDDISAYNHYANPSPFPINKVDTNYAADNLKWSLYGSKVIQKHVKISVQAASDHYRPGIFKGYGDNNSPSNQAILLKPSHWYWSSKVAYFF